MITEKRRRGDMGEDFAAEYLAGKGYEIIERNFNTRLGEIDIVAKDGKYIAFIEVKSRAEDCLYAPREAVTRSKQQKICKAAMLYKLKKGLNGQPRFDVFEIVYGKYDLEVKSFTHIKNAFGTEAVHGFF